MVSIWATRAITRNTANPTQNTIGDTWVSTADPARVSVLKQPWFARQSASYGPAPSQGRQFHPSTWAMIAITVNAMKLAEHAVKLASSCSVSGQ